MAYMALYRKFRPQTFAQVKGQEHVVQTLKNQIKNDRIGHAYLFTGTRGTGKTSVAKLFARAINCTESVDGEPCNQCENCQGALNESLLDIVEVDAASNTGVDDIRKIIDEVQYSPVKGKYKVYIVDEVHMLTTSAFNAFLKTLEEPPAYTVFILATTEPHKLPITILSRCQRYDFKRISNEIISGNLEEIVNAEQVPYEKKALDYVAKMGDGSMRDSISLLDKCIAFSMGEKLTYEVVLNTLGTVDTETFSNIFKAVFGGDAVTALNELEKAVYEGKDLGQFVSDFLWYLRNILLVRNDSGSAGNILGMSAENIKKLEADASIADERVLMRYIRIISELLGSIRYSATKQILVEVAFIKMAKPEMETDTDSLLDRIRHLEMAPARVQYQEAPSLAKVNPAENRAPLLGSDEPEETKAGRTVEDHRTPEDDGERKDLRQAPETGEICKMWSDVADACASQRLKIALKRTRPVQNGDVVDIYSTGTAYGTIKESIGTVESLIKQVCNQAIKVNVIEGVPKVSSQQLDDVFPEDVLKNININIGTEEI